MADDDLSFEFEAQLEQPSNALPSAPGQGGGFTGAGADTRQLDIAALPTEMLGQQLATFRKNFKKTVCTYWLRGMCMKGDACGFLHQYDVERMPVCRNLLRHGECKDIDCPFKHDIEEIKECNMYRLGFCIYGPQCRFKHRPLPGPPPAPEKVEAAKPREFRDINRVVSSVNPTVQFEEYNKNQRRPREWGMDNDPSKRPRALPWIPSNSGSSNPPPGSNQQGPPLALPAPGPRGPQPSPMPSFAGPRPPMGMPPPMGQHQQQQPGLGLAGPPPGPRPPPGGPRPPPGPPPPHLANPSATSNAPSSSSQQQQQQPASTSNNTNASGGNAQQHDGAGNGQSSTMPNIMQPTMPGIMPSASPNAPPGGMGMPGMMGMMPPQGPGYPMGMMGMMGGMNPMMMGPGGMMPPPGMMGAMGGPPGMMPPGMMGMMAPGAHRPPMGPRPPHGGGGGGY